jgi:glutathione synthase/RimK-type ligase-like ATP-grasp enzyme
MFKIYPYNSGSASARLLGASLPARILRRVGSRWRGTSRDWMINWGAQGVPRNGARIINDPQAVSRAANKILAFRSFRDHGVRTPEWSTNQGDAQGWAAAGHTVIVRRIVSGSEGRGIEIVQPGGRVPHAPLYTRYVKKRHEYRVHCMRGEIIDYAEKLHRRGGDHSLIRNTANGYIFARTGVQLPEDVGRQALSAVRALGLDFGAVDVVFNERQGQAYVLEVNTAPGIEGTTVTRYAEAFRRLFR